MRKYIKFYRWIEGFDTDWVSIDEKEFSMYMKLKIKMMAKNVKLREVTHG